MSSLSELLGPDAPWPGLLALLALVAAGGLSGRLWIERGNGPPVGVIAGMVSMLGAFGLFAWQVYSQGPLSRLDLVLVQWLQQHRTLPLTDALLVVTQLHNPVPVTMLMIGVGLWLLVRGQYRWLASFVLAAAGGTTLNMTLKHLFVRARFVDDQAVLPAFTSFSFPSGHVAAATLLYGFIAIYLTAMRHRTPARLVALSLPITMILLVAFSRMYLGAHYLSDVLAAAILAGFWLSLCNYIVRGNAASSHRTTRQAIS